MGGFFHYMMCLTKPFLLRCKAVQFDMPSKHRDSIVVSLAQMRCPKVWNLSGSKNQFKEQYIIYDICWLDKPRPLSDVSGTKFYWCSVVLDRLPKVNSKVHWSGPAGNVVYRCHQQISAGGALRRAWPSGCSMEACVIICLVYAWFSAKLSKVLLCNWLLDRENGRSAGQYNWDYSRKGMDFLGNGGFAFHTQHVYTKSKTGSMI